MACPRPAEDAGLVMKMHNETASSELPSILRGTLLAIAALALSFIASAMAVEPPASESLTHRAPLTAFADLLRFP